MSDREKLIDLIQSAVNGCDRYWAELIADNLIANGVTVDDDNDFRARWIPVSEILPICGEKVLITNGESVWEARISMNHKKWVRSGSWIDVNEATYWMPMPQAPKGE